MSTYSIPIFIITMNWLILHPHRFKIWESISPEISINMSLPFILKQWTYSKSTKLRAEVEPKHFFCSVLLGFGRFFHVFLPRIWLVHLWPRKGEAAPAWEGTGTRRRVAKTTQGAAAGGWSWGIMVWTIKYILVGGLEHFLFSHILGMSSSQLTL